MQCNGYKNNFELVIILIPIPVTFYNAYRLINYLASSIGKYVSCIHDGLVIHNQSYTRLTSSLVVIFDDEGHRKHLYLPIGMRLLVMKNINRLKKRITKKQCIGRHVSAIEIYEILIFFLYQEFVLIYKKCAH